MKSEILEEIKDFHFETSFAPRYSDLTASRYLINKEFGSLAAAIIESEIFKNEKVIFNEVCLLRPYYEDIVHQLEEELYYHALVFNEFPKKEDCGRHNLSDYKMFLKYIGGFKENILLYDNIRSMVSSRREILGLDKPRRYFDKEDFSIEEKDLGDGIEYELMYCLVLERLEELKLDLVNDFRYGSTWVEYSELDEEWEYKIHRYNKYEQQEFKAVFGRFYTGERFQKTEPVVKLWK